MPSFHLVLLDSTDASALPPGVQNALAQSAMVLTCHVGIDAEALDGARGDDLVACVTDANFAQLVKSMADLATAASSSPLSLLSPPLDEAAHAALVEAGVHAWSSIDRVEKGSLEAMLAQARARCRREAALRLELVQMRTQMDDRKWVEKAKGLLMLARGMGEGEAFAMLRQTSMHAICALAKWLVRLSTRPNGPRPSTGRGNCACCRSAWPGLPHRR
jgi:AmiR/NasT family two-component response regulator